MSCFFGYRFCCFRIVLTQVNGCTRESDFQPQLCQRVHDLQADIFAGIEVFPPHGRGGKAIDHDVEGRSTEVGEVDQEEILIDGRVSLQEFANPTDGFTQLCRSGVVCAPTVRRMRRLGIRLKLSSAILAIMLFGTAIKVLAKVRILVERKPTSSTVPSISPALIQSPT